jgi:hypothetical protein
VIAAIKHLILRRDNTICGWHEKNKPIPDAIFCFPVTTMFYLLSFFLRSPKSMRAEPSRTMVDKNEDPVTEATTIAHSSQKSPLSGY